MTTSVTAPAYSFVTNAMGEVTFTGVRFGYGAEPLLAQRGAQPRAERRREEQLRQKNNRRRITKTGSYYLVGV